MAVALACVFSAVGGSYAGARLDLLDSEKVYSCRNSSGQDVVVSSVFKNSTGKPVESKVTVFDTRQGMVGRVVYGKKGAPEDIHKFSNQAS